MPTLDTPVSSLPSRPLEMDQDLAQLEDSGRFEAIIHSEKSIEVGAESSGGFRVVVYPSWLAENVSVTGFTVV